MANKFNSPDTGYIFLLLNTVSVKLISKHVRDTITVVLKMSNSKIETKIICLF